MKKDQNTSPETQENIIWKRTKIALRFWRRHFFTLPIGILFLFCLMIGSEAVFTIGFWLLIASIFTYGKPDTSERRTDPNEYKGLHHQQQWNSSLMGTMAYNSRTDLNH